MRKMDSTRLRNSRLLLVFAPLVLIAALSCSRASSPVPLVTELPESFKEVDAREVFKKEILEQCDSLGITLGLNRAMRQVEAALATRTPSHWQFRLEGRSAQVYASGEVFGELLSHLVGVCQEGNR